MIILACVSCGVGGFCLVCWLPPGQVEEFYKTDLRGAFFVAFLTLGGFLLSLKTFIVVKMKELLYDSQSYVSRLEDRRRVDPKATHYGTLKNLSELLFWSILLCFGASVLQFTVGVLLERWSVALCVGAAASAICLLVITLFVTRQNLHDMFQRAEEDSLKKHPGRATGGPDSVQPGE